ncbi:MAG: hypothetical protein Q9180_006960, partial [Flavoplaca navasiana]
CSAASAFLTLPRYQANFANLRKLTLWPGLRSPEVYPCPEDRILVREPATEEIEGLLQGIGLDLSKLQVKVLYSRKEGIRREDVRQMQISVFPYLRFVGQQRARKMGSGQLYGRYEKLDSSPYPAVVSTPGRNDDIGVLKPCSGAKITSEAFFEYTNGRFLTDEKRQLAKRHLKFDLTNLCEEASRVTNGSTVQRVEKMEGGFSKALLMTMNNGKEVVAKLPCPNAGRAMYSTASEAAVLHYRSYIHRSQDCQITDIVIPVSTHTQVPTPKLLAWNANATNPVGAEYIIMEKAPGVQLFTVWDDVSAADRLKLIKSLTQLEHQFATINFPAYGSLYHRQSISKPSERVDLDPSVDPGGHYCVGPSCSPAWTNGSTAADLNSMLDMGPLEGLDLHQYGSALAQRSASRTCLPMDKTMSLNLQGTPEDHAILRDMALKLLPYLTGSPTLQQGAKPVLWHTDLHMGNMFVSETDHSQIVSIIDWQHTSISPHFLQARWPVFLSPPDNYTLGPNHPELPEDYGTFDPHDKELALFEKEKADNSKAYEIATYLNNRATYKALWEIDEPIREFFNRIGDTWDD